jgi:Fic family protein
MDPTAETGTDLIPSSRAGRYLPQVGCYRAFIPAPLPPKPPVVLNEPLQKLLSAADRALGRLDGSIQTLPHPNLSVMMYVRQEAVPSSQIESTQSSLQDLLAAEAEVLGSDRPRDVDEIVNYVAAMDHGLRRLAGLPVSIRLIREIREILLQGVRGSRHDPGEIRTTQNWIGATGASLHEAVFVPPPPAEVAPALAALERFLHEQDSIPLLIKVGLAHAQFETIHPFLDGNGRVGRLLITLLLSEQQVLSKPVLYLSHYFKRHRASYYEHLQAVRDTGDWEAWLSFFLRGVSAVSTEAAEKARRILVLREEHRTAITEQFGRAAGNGHRVLEELFTRPVISVERVIEVTGVTFSAANGLVDRFVEAGILTEFTGRRRHRRFRYDPYVQLFSDND